ncbi:MAG: dTMP kinase [Pelagibacteraceae bacterium]|nr:dTMP kinase [Pelagibacteraceae bacterium]PHX88725.1 MAG: dTMP kinase [Pelagibacteraceae bacterium]
MSKKPIIVFEGIECSGKSYHINQVAKYLDNKKINYFKFREPGGSINSEKIRKLILDDKYSFNKNTDLLLYLAARSENINELKKHINKKIILIDRFIDSTVAYQHYGMNVDLKIINQINQFLLSDIKVNFTFLNIVNKKNMFLRLKERKKINRYDKFNSGFYSKVQKGFLQLASRNKKLYQIIDTNLDVNSNHKIIIDKIETLI